MSDLFGHGFGYGGGFSRFLAFPNPRADLTLPGAAGAWGAWVQVYAAGTVPQPGYLLAVGTGVAGFSSTWQGIAFAAGPAGGETVIYETEGDVNNNALHHNALSTDEYGIGSGTVRLRAGGFLPYPVRIPGGARLAARIFNKTGTTAQDLIVCHVGVP